MRLIRLAAAALCATLLNVAQPGRLADLTSGEANSGLKEALSTGAEFAVTSLGKENGFFGNKKVKIPLPESLETIEKGLRALGMGKQADELVLTMNRAAEKAVVKAKPILVNAIKSMSVQDAKGILTGGEDSVTQFFRKTTSDKLAVEFLPIVKDATQKVDLAKKYNKFAKKGASLGLIDKKDADLDNYVTEKAMDGLFLMIAEKEKSIRANPLGAGSDMLKKVFSSLN